MFFLMKSCEGEPKVVTKTVTKIEIVHDTINETIIKEVPKIVYVDKWNIIQLAKIAEPNKVHRVKCKRTGSSSDKEYDHYIFDLDAYWGGK